MRAGPCAGFTPEVELIEPVPDERLVTHLLSVRLEPDVVVGSRAKHQSALVREWCKGGGHD